MSRSDDERSTLEATQCLTQRATTHTIASSERLLAKFCPHGEMSGDDLLLQDLENPIRMS
jgi:hypothetical protein